MIGVLGDIHGAFDSARTVIRRHPDVPVWLCVGDIADEQGRYESIGAPVYWIHGNNDNFDAIASGDLPEDLHHVGNGTVVTIAGSVVTLAGSEDPAYDGRIAGSEDPAYTRNADVGRVFRPAGPPVRPAGLRIAGLGGTFAPTWYDTAAADLPHPKKGSVKATELADKRRHFVREEVEACAALRDIDVFLTHEAARPFRPFAGNRGPDAGKAQINEILAAMQPRLHLFGHHHRWSDQVREGVRSVGLDLVTRGYLLIDAGSLEIHTVKY